MKKVYIMIYAFLISFMIGNVDADLVSIHSMDENEIHRCAKLLNTDIDGYNVYLYGKKNYRHEMGIFKPIKNKCISDSYGVYLINKSYKINNIMEIENNIDKFGSRIGILPGTTYEKVECLENEKEENIWAFITPCRGERKEYTEIYKIDKIDGIYGLHLVERIEGINDNDDTGRNMILIDYTEKIYIYKFIISLLLTIIIETLMLFLIAKFCWKSWSIKNRKIIVTGILASTVTLPLLWFVLPIFFSNYLVYVIFGETLVTVIETFIIKYSLKIDWKMAIFASIICNLCSFLVGLFIF